MCASLPAENFSPIADHVPGGDDGRVVIIDTHGNRKASSSFYSSVEGLAWSPNGKEVWFSAVPARLRAVDLCARFLRQRTPHLSRPRRTHHAGHQPQRPGSVDFRQNPRSAFPLSPPGETRERSLSWFDWSLLTDMSADGKTIIFSESGEAVGSNYSIFLRKTDGSPAVRLGDGGFGFLSPDGQWVVSQIGSPAKLMLLPTGVGEPRQLTDDKVEHSGVAWLPDSKSIIFSEPRPDMVLAPISGHPRWRAPRPDARGHSGISHNPDGQHIFVRDLKRQLWLYPTAGGEPQKLDLSLTTDDIPLGFSPDGKSLVVATRGVPLKIAHVISPPAIASLGKKSLPPIPPACNASSISSSAQTANPMPTPPFAFFPTSTSSMA